MSSSKQFPFSRVRRVLGLPDISFAGLSIAGGCLENIVHNLNRRPSSDVDFLLPDNVEQAMKIRRRIFNELNDKGCTFEIMMNSAYTCFIISHAYKFFDVPAEEQQLTELRYKELKIQLIHSQGTWQQVVDYFDFSHLRCYYNIDTESFEGDISGIRNFTTIPNDNALPYRLRKYWERGFDIKLPLVDQEFERIRFRHNFLIKDPESVLSCYAKTDFLSGEYTQSALNPNYTFYRTGMPVEVTFYEHPKNTICLDSSEIDNYEA